MKFLLTILAAGMFSSAYAQDKSVLYEVTGKGLAQPSYLYGTFHLICPTDLQMTAATRKAMADSKQLYLEIDMDDPTFQVTMMKGLMFSDGRSLRDVVKPEDYALIDAYMKQNLGTGLALLNSTKPVVILSMLYAGLMKCQPASYDMAFAEMAAREKKEILGLETVEAQIAVLDKIPMDQQVKGLVDMAKKPEAAQKELADFMNAYKAQDLPQLMKLMQESQFDTESGFEEELLDKRNINWIPVIEKAAREKSTFFAFGAGHLGGDKGVVNLLRQKGYTVRPLH